MFTFKWLAVPSLCAALLLAPTSPVLADSSTHEKKAKKTVEHKPTSHKKSKKAVAAMSKAVKGEDAPVTKAKKTAHVSAKKKKTATMSATTTPPTSTPAPAKTKGKVAGKKTAKHKTHKHA